MLRDFIVIHTSEMAEKRKNSIVKKKGKAKNREKKWYQY